MPQKNLTFACQQCQHLVAFSLLEGHQLHNPLVCTHCSKTYLFEPALIDSITRFELLCQAIHQAKDILASTHVAVTIGQQEVKVPFNVLLTRLSSQLDLEIQGKKLSIVFRVAATENSVCSITHL